MALAIGQTLQQRYQIQDILGQGGMGVVYQAYDPVLQRTVAIKVLPAQLTIDADFVHRFQREAVASANLRHPHIVTVYDVGQQDGEYFIIMECLTGITLEQWLVQHGPMPVAQTSQVLEQIASALDYAHSRSIVHRDVKPSNVMFDAQGRAVLMDFGLVRAGEGFGPTRSNTVMGTPEYMAPEQILGQAIDRRTDIYALGVVLHELLTGKTPFHRTSPIATAYAHVHEAPPPVRLLNKTVPQSVEAVVLKALAKDPTARYQNAGDLARDFAFAVSGARPAGLVAPLPAAGSRKKPSASLADGVKMVAMPSPASGTPSAPARPDRRKAGVYLVAVGALATLVVLVGVVLVLNNRSATPAAAVIATSATLSTATAASEVLADSGNPLPSVTTTRQLAATAIPLTPKLTAAQSSPTVTSTGVLPTSTATARAAAVTRTVVPTAARSGYQSAPVLLNPANGADASIDQNFSWRWDGPALRADERFEWRLQRTPSGETLVAARIVATPDVTLSMGSLPGGEYYWGVRVVQVFTNGERNTLRSPEATRRLLRWLPPTQVPPTNTPRPTDPPVTPRPTDPPVTPRPTDPPVTPLPTNTLRPPATATPQPTNTPEPPTAEPPPTATPTPPISLSAMQTGDAQQDMRDLGAGGAIGFGVFLTMIGLDWWGQRRRNGIDHL